MNQNIYIYQLYLIQIKNTPNEIWPLFFLIIFAKNMQIENMKPVHSFYLHSNAKHQIQNLLLLHNWQVSFNIFLKLHGKEFFKPKYDTVLF